jgi:cell division protein FtsB
MTLEHNNKIIWISVGFNILLIIGLVLFIAFGRSKPIPKYEAEIATLTTMNSILEGEIMDLAEDKYNSDETIAKYTKELDELSNELAKSKREIIRLKKQRDEIPDFIRNLPNDSVAGEFTRYLQRRNKRKTGE